MLFADMMQSVQALVTENLPIAVGAVVAVLVLLALFVSNRRRFRIATPVVTTNAVKEEKALNWAPPEQSYADRRGAVRRDGGPVRVQLSSPTFRSGVNDAYVVDRSTGGLRIAIQTALPPGSSVGVRALNAPDTIAFVTVLVRTCRKSGDYYELGCEFEKTPPWNVLLLFG